ncbi:MerR family transcriptional regulator [Planctomonas psychrotolerans]|uniref:MerR family transcriptional regulator n=1 Tax=Planctomonas psychrotolerans TaxID=2528712 RepID=UPI001239994E|nr:MerR family transcriptional regulator [Planctomonas psychrotolerans]
MRLGELSEATGVSPASIKFYLRSGLLAAGDPIHPTRADYGDRHVRRLALIQGLRSVVGLGLDDIRRILDAAIGADDSPAQRLMLLRTVQHVVLGLDGSPAEPSPSVDGLVQAMGWPGDPSEARFAVDRHVAAMEAAGIAPGADVLAAYGRAADAIAEAQLTVTHARDDLEDVILTAAIGMHMHNQLILKIVALAQASHSIRRYGGPPRDDG